MSNVFNIGDRVTVKGLNGVVKNLGADDDFGILLDNGKMLYVLATKTLGANPNPLLIGIPGFVAYKKDIVKLPNTTAPTATATAPTATATAPTVSVPPPRPSAPTVVGPISSRPITADSSVFKLTSRPSGRRSYDIDTGAIPTAGSTTIPPPISRSTDSTLSFLTPRKKSCAGAVAGVV